MATITADGEVTLDSYLTPAKQDNSERLAELNRIIEQCEKQVLPSEIEVLKKLKFERAKLEAPRRYPELDPSFLSMHNAIEVEEHEIGKLAVPRFTVYPVFANNEFEMTFTGNWVWPINFWGTPCPSGALFITPIPEDRRMYHNGTRGIILPKLFTKHLEKSTEYGRLAQGIRPKEKFDSLPKDIRKKYAKLIKHFRRKNRFGYDESHYKALRSRFCAVVPSKTKEKIEKAREIFSNDSPILKDGLYFIAETAPEEWYVEKVVTKVEHDPLVVGVLDDRCFLVDHFDTTHIEDYVTKEFGM